jgi:hypothetical protein
MDTRAITDRVVSRIAGAAFGDYKVFGRGVIVSIEAGAGMYKHGEVEIKESEAEAAEDAVIAKAEQIEKSLKLVPGASIAHRSKLSWTQSHDSAYVKYEMKIDCPSASLPAIEDLLGRMGFEPY